VEAEAVLAAAMASDGLRAVVAADGRPDRAVPSLADVKAATLLVVGGEDGHVLRLARATVGRVAGEHAVAVVPGSTHRFAEPGRSPRWRITPERGSRATSDASVDSAPPGRASRWPEARFLEMSPHDPICSE
jgi:hypothetical protein